MLCAVEEIMKVNDFKNGMEVLVSLCDEDGDIIPDREMETITINVMDTIYRNTVNDMIYIKKHDKEYSFYSTK